LETHPKTGAAQLVEIRETVQEIRVPRYVEQPEERRPKKPLFSQLTDDELLSFGVPTDWLDSVRQADEDSLLTIADHLPGEAAEALLELATGGKPRPAAVAAAPVTPFDHPDAQRRFRIMSNVEELERALEFPWDKWTVFLHPEQREWVEKDYSGPVRVSGSAGTGKTIVALHRAVHLARRDPEARVLLATLTEPLAHSLATGLRRLASNEPHIAERIDVYSMESLGVRLYRTLVGPLNLASRDVVNGLLAEASSSVGAHKFSPQFLRTEWDQVVDAWQLDGWESYRDVPRLGRKTRLSGEQRKVLWSIFERLRAALADRSLITQAGVFTKLAASVGKARRPPFEYAVVDEAQDVSVAQLKFFAALGDQRPNALFFSGDLGQRIFQQPFSWKALGVDIRGRGRTLRVNYRTSHQIRLQADRLLGAEVADVDGNTDVRTDTVSVFNGPPPVIRAFGDEAEEAKAVGAWIGECIRDSVAPHEIGIFVRSPDQLNRARAAAEAGGIPYKVLDERVETVSGYASIGTMHLAKGLEFRAVAVMACDDEVIPLQSRIESVGDDADLQGVYDTERQLLYVACTRARDRLMVTSVEPASEFLDDLLATPY
jgi:superfamily I DNA/RNA helicase